MVWTVLFQIAIAVGFAALAYVLRPKPKKKQPSITRDLEAPTAEAGRPIPVIFGTVNIKGGNILYFTDKHKREDENYPGNYFQYMSVHYGICQGGPVSLLRVTINDINSWAGKIDTSGTFSIPSPGGHKPYGQVYYQNGESSQDIDAVVAAKYGRTSATMGNYRGIATAMLCEKSDWSDNGFFWGNNISSIPATQFKVMRIYRDWNPDEAELTVKKKERSLSVFFSVESNIHTRSIPAIRLAFDSLKKAIENNIRINIGVVIWGFSRTYEKTFFNASISNINELLSFIEDDTHPEEFWGRYSLASEKAEAFMTSTLSDTNKTGRRLWFFITSGNLASDLSDDFNRAVSIARDMLDKTSGSFSAANRTEVDCHAVNVWYTAITYSRQFDNTPDDARFVTHKNISYIREGTNPALKVILDKVLPISDEIQDISLMNPAHIIWECLTNQLWGMGSPVSLMDDGSFRIASKQLSQENFGLALIWNDQTTIEAFVQEVLDHISGFLYVSPNNGKFVLKLIREDYIADALPVFDESNCTITEYNKRLPGEITNEINVTWTNPETEKEEVMTIQDLGAIIAAGGEIITDNRNFYGVKNPDVAWEIAKREMATEAASLIFATIETNRASWDFAPGDLFKLTSEEFGAHEEIMRINNINYGTPGNSTIVINAVQDVFDVNKPEFEEPPETSFREDTLPPWPTEDVIFFTLNFFLWYGGYIYTPTIVNPKKSDSFLGVLASTDNPDERGFNLWGTFPDITGRNITRYLGTKDYIVKAQLIETFRQEEITTTEGFTHASGSGATPKIGTLAMIGNAELSDNEFEMVLLTQFDGTHYTFLRGILDTVPKTWDIGEEIRFFNANANISDTSLRIVGDEVTYDLRMNTELGEAAAGESVFTTRSNARAWLPTRPANIHVNNKAWADIKITDPTINSISCFWANRNRNTELRQPLSWNAPSVTPEDNQKTIISMFSGTDTDTSPFHTIVIPYNVTSYDIPIQYFNNRPLVTLKFYARINNHTSFTGHERKIYSYTELAGGWGVKYGLDYGGR